MRKLYIKGVDVMKLSKDTVAGQLATSAKQQLMLCLSALGATHVAISVPMDTDAQMADYGNTPSPRTISGETRDWIDVIHNAGMKVMHRGTFSGTENIYSFPYNKYGTVSAIAIGTTSGAAAAGETSWNGKIYRYINSTVGEDRWLDGDVFSPIPEATSHAFDGNQFWVSTDSTNNYASAFNTFKATADGLFSSYGVEVPFVTFHNYSEVASGWIPQWFFTNQGYVGFDYYGQAQGAGLNSVANYLTDLNAISAKGTLFQGEWGDIAGEALPTPTTINERLGYLSAFYTMLRDNFVNNQKMVGFNYWGGWSGQNTSLLYANSAGNLDLNARGKMLSNFYRNDSNINPSI